MRESYRVGRDVDPPEHDGEREPPRTDRARVEDRDATITADEGHMRVPTNHERRAFGLGRADDLGAELRPVYGDMYEQDAQAQRLVRDHVDAEQIR